MRFVINGDSYEAAIDLRTSVLDLLRESAGLLTNSAMGQKLK